MKKHCFTVVILFGLFAIGESPVYATPVGSAVPDGIESIGETNSTDNSGIETPMIVGRQSLMPFTGTVAVQAQKAAAPSFNGLSVQNMKNTATYINRLQLVKSPSGLSGKGGSSDQAYQDAVSTLAGVTSRIIEAEQTRSLRAGELIESVRKIGSAEDTKAAIEENSRLQVQTIQALHDLNKLMSGVSISLQKQEERSVTEASEVSKMYLSDD